LIKYLFMCVISVKKKMYSVHVSDDHAVMYTLARIVRRSEF